VQISYTSHNGDVTCGGCRNSLFFVFERRENLVQNGMLHFMFRISQLKKIEKFLNRVNILYTIKNV